jgi:hypothetical protein
MIKRDLRKISDNKIEKHVGKKIIMDKEKKIDYCGFTDESGYNTGKIRSLAMLSMPTEYVENCNNMLEKILSEKDIKIKSFKWYKIQNNKKCKVLVQILDYLFNMLKENHVRIDVLMWNIQDSRHNVLQRDDITNLEIMYYNLMKNVVSKRWESGKEWKIISDRNSTIDWKKLKDILSNKGLIKYEPVGSKLSIKIGYPLVNITESSTKENYLIQIADIFAGMGRTSYEDVEKYKEYIIYKESPTKLISSETQKFSNRDRYRCYFYNCVKKFTELNKYNVSLESAGGFKSWNPKVPLNFWFYTPQHEEDKAPTKK